jgi:hypothetical protein
VEASSGFEAASSEESRVRDSEEEIEASAALRGRGGRARSTAEVGEEPEEEREGGAEEETGDNREVERGVFAAMEYVAGEFSQAEGEFRTKIKKCAQEDEEAAEEEKCAAEFAGGIHGRDSRGTATKK